MSLCASAQLPTTQAWGWPTCRELWMNSCSSSTRAAVPPAGTTGSPFSQARPAAASVSQATVGGPVRRRSTEVRDKVLILFTFTRHLGWKTPEIPVKLRKEEKTFKYDQNNFSHHSRVLNRIFLKPLGALAFSVCWLLLPLDSWIPDSISKLHIRAADPLLPCTSSSHTGC